MGLRYRRTIEVRKVRPLLAPLLSRKFLHKEIDIYTANTCGIIVLGYNHDEAATPDRLIDQLTSSSSECQFMYMFPSSYRLHKHELKGLFVSFSTSCLISASSVVQGIGLRGILE